MSEKTRGNTQRKQRFSNRQWRPQAATAFHASILKPKKPHAPLIHSHLRLQLHRADTIPLPFIPFSIGVLLLALSIPIRVHIHSLDLRGERRNAESPEDYRRQHENTPRQESQQGCECRLPGRKQTHPSYQNLSDTALPPDNTKVFGADSQPRPDGFSALSTEGHVVRGAFL